MGPCDFRLIELVRQNKLLYDKSDPDFRNLEKKEITWRAIAAAQGSTSEICRRRFRSLRDSFVREKRQNKQLLLEGEVSNPIWLKMMFLWDHLRPTRRFNWNRSRKFQNAKHGALSIQNVYTVVPVDSSGVPIPNYPVASASYILVDAAEENSPKVAGMNSSVVEVQGPSEAAEHVSPEFSAQELSEVVSDVEEQVSPEAVAEVLSDVEEQVSSKAATEEPSDVAEVVSPEVVAVVPSDTIEETPEAVVKVPSDVTELKPFNHEYPEIVTQVLQSMSKFPILPQSRGKKRLKNNITSRKWSKKTKTAKMLPAKNIGSSVSPAKTTANSSCNAAFCAVVNNYLDKISNPMRLSSTRIKILSMVHDEMYSANR